MQLTGSNVEETNGADAALKSNLVSGKSPMGKQLPLNVDEYGILRSSYSVINTGKSLTNADSEVSGDSLNCANGLSARMIVTGEFDASVLLDVKINGIWGNYLPLYLVTGERRGNYTKGAGVYYADIPIGATEIKAYLGEYVSGSASATIDVMTVPFVSQYLMHTKNVLLATSSGFVVEAGVTTTVTFIGRRYNAIDISDFPYLYVVVRGAYATTVNSYNVYFSYRCSSPLPFGSPLPDVEVIDSATAFGDITRSCSEWIESKGNSVTVRIKNNDSAQRAFDVYLYGVR